MSPGENPEEASGAFLAGQLDNPEMLVLAAERTGLVVGYAWAAIEPESYKGRRAYRTVAGVRIAQDACPVAVRARSS